MKAFVRQFIMTPSTVRWLEILYVFERKNIVSTKELAKLTDSSIRTIINDISQLKERFAGTITIHSTQNGYSFKKNDSLSYQQIKQNLILNEPLLILLEALFLGELLSFSEWALKLHTSESSLLRQLKKMEKILVPFCITLNYSPISFHGNEIDIRKFFHVLYYESDLTPHTIQPTKAVQKIVLDFFQSEDGKIKNRNSFWSLCYWLYISLERHKINQKIYIPQDLKNILLKDPSFTSIHTLNDRLTDAFLLELPESELMYLYSLILCERNLDSPLVELNFIERNNHWPSLYKFTEDFCTHMEIPSDQLSPAVIFFQSFFLSEKLKNLLSPTYNLVIWEIEEHVTKYYSLEFAKIKMFVEKNKLKLQGNMLKELSIKLCLFFESVQLIYGHQPRRIAFLIEGDSHLQQHIKAFVTHHFSRYHFVSFPDSNSFSVSYIKDHDINLIVTNYMDYTEEYINDIDYLLMQTFPDASDWNNLIQKLNPKILRTLSLSNTLDTKES